MTTYLNKNTYDNLHQLIIRLAKRKIGIASSAANILMINEDLIGIKALWQKHIEQSITEWTIRINDENLLGQTTRGRLRQAQIDLLSTEPIWDISEENLNSQTLKNNLNAKILLSAKRLGLSIANNCYTEDWRISSHNKKAINITPLIELKKLGKSETTPAKLNIWFLDQLLDVQGNHLVT